MTSKFWFSTTQPKEGFPKMKADKKALAAASLARLGAFDKDENVEIVLPEDLSTLSNDELVELHGKAVAAFNELRAEEGLNAAKVQTLRDLKAAASALSEEKAKRDADEAALAAEVEALAAELNAPAEEVAEVEDEAEVVAEAEVEGTEEDEADVVAEAEAVAEEAAKEPVTAATYPRSISVPGIKARQSKTKVEDEAPKSPITAALGLDSFAAGATLDMEQLADAFAELSEAARPGPIQAAKAQGARFSQKHKVAHIAKPFDERAVVGQDGNADAAVKFAVDQSRLKGGSLVAAGSWCAPSETLYDLCKLESTDGILSVPEIAVRRGGIRFTQGPDWADIFANTGFCFTEADDEAGNYDGASSGTSPKPTDIVPCPEFTDVRLDVCGVTIQAGILMNRAYPELVQRYVSGALTAHAHRVATNVLADMIAGSTAVTPTALTNGTGVASPVLSAIELQAEDIKYRYRMARGTVLEAVFPFWARGAIRADLSRRLGVELLSVTDAQIDGWFRQRGISPQFIYNFDNLGTNPTGALVWPTTLRFLIYPAGTWVKGSSELITLSMLHDSTLNENNNFTAIFTEEGWSVMKMCHVSRVVSVAICPNGNTHSGSGIACP
jgi:hypothetical protein